MDFDGTCGQTHSGATVIGVFWELLVGPLVFEFPVLTIVHCGVEREIIFLLRDR